VDLPAQVIAEAPEARSVRSKQRQPATPLAESKPHQDTILVIDDDASVRDLTSRFLSKLDFRLSRREWAKRDTARATSSAISHHTGCDYAGVRRMDGYKETEERSFIGGDPGDHGHHRRQRSHGHLTGSFQLSYQAGSTETVLRC